MLVHGSECTFEKSLVIDLGTAIKYLYVKKHFMWSNNRARMEISLAALTKTPLCSEDRLKNSKKILGNDTVSCMQSMFYMGPQVK